MSRVHLRILSACKMRRCIVTCVSIARMEVGHRPEAPCSTRQQQRGRVRRAHTRTWCHHQLVRASREAFAGGPFIGFVFGSFHATKGGQRDPRRCARDARSRPAYRGRIAGSVKTESVSIIDLQPRPRTELRERNGIEMTTTPHTAGAPAVWVTVQTKGSTFDEAVIDGWELTAARRALRNLKSVIGGLEMMELLAEQIRAGDDHHKAIVAASADTWRESRAEFAVRGLSGTDLANWFRGQAATGRFQDKTLLVNAHPEHYGEPPEYVGGMVETIDGYLTRFQVSVAHELPEAVARFREEAYPITLMNALLSLDDGTPLAYCVHQARDTDEGADVVVRVVYPGAAPDSLIEAHCEHLSIEFRSWIRNAAAAQI